ncbi:MAG: hypothetical protein ACYDDF_08750 [Thermoplasmatota archaeon]
MDRRAFVKGCIAAAGVGAAAATGISFAAPVIIPRPPPGQTITYWGFHKVGGPAPRGVPLIPLKLVGGSFHGNPTATGPGGVDILNWYKYCGHSEAKGLESNFPSNSQLTYFISDERLAQIEAQGLTVWYKDLLGQPIKPGDFPGPAYGAGFIWRSEGQSGTSVLTGVIIRAPRETAWTPQDPAFTPPRYVPPAKPIKDADWPTIRDSFLYLGPEGRFVAASTFCTHFCCIPGWHEAKFAQSIPDPTNGGVAWDRMFCTCHGSIYYPFQLAQYDFQPDVIISPIGGS